MTRKPGKTSGLLTSSNRTIVRIRFAEVRVRRLPVVRVRISDVESKRTVGDRCTRPDLVQVGSPDVNSLSNPTDILYRNAKKVPSKAKKVPSNVLT